MVTRAHSARTPLLRLSGSVPPLLGKGLGRQPGPVTQAIRAMRSDLGFDCADFSALSRTEVETLVEGLINLLDAMDGDTDLEDGADAEPSLCGLMAHWPSPGGDDRELDPAEGRDPIPDWSGRGVHEVFVGRRL